jgi:hypothetical protein
MVAPALFAYYPFSETSGTVATDASGNNHHGTIIGGATFVTGLIGNALNLNNASANAQYVALPSGMLQTLHDVTIALWVRSGTNGVGATIWDFGSNTTTYMALRGKVADAGNPMRAAITVSGNASEQQLAGPPLLVDSWTHIVMVLGSNQQALYVNGLVQTLSSTVVLRPADLGATVNDWLGRSQFAGDPYFNGALDEVRIYDGALGSTQIADLYLSR